MDLTPVGLWTHALDTQPIGRARELAAELDELGFGSILVPEMAGRDPLVFSDQLLDATSRIVIGTGIAGIWSRDALTMNGGHRALTKMRTYLDAMDAAPYFAYQSDTTPVRVLAALGPKMLELAASRAAGAHPYFVPVEHTAYAREHLGPDALLLPEQKVVLETDPV